MAKKDVNGITGRVELRRKQLGEYRAKLDDTEKARREKANTPENSDTVMRKNIHKDIKTMLADRKGKVEILITLSNKYKDTYLSKFFEQWIDYHIEKKDYIKVVSKDDDEAR